MKFLTFTWRIYTCGLLTKVSASVQGRRSPTDSGSPLWRRRCFPPPDAAAPPRWPPAIHTKCLSLSLHLCGVFDKDRSALRSWCSHLTAERLREEDVCLRSEGLEVEQRHRGTATNFCRTGDKWIILSHRWSSSHVTCLVCLPACRCVCTGW